MTPGDLLRGLGFLALTLVPVTLTHLVEQPTVGELIDAIVTSVVITVVFIAGGVLGRNLARRRGGLCRSNRIQIGLGAAAALLLQFLLWSFWLFAPDTWREADERWAWYAHLAVTAILGSVTCWLASRTGREKEKT